MKTQLRWLVVVWVGFVAPLLGATTVSAHHNDEEDDTAYYIDLGSDEGDEEIVDGEGFGARDRVPFACPLLIDIAEEMSDFDLRNQRMGQANSVWLSHLEVGEDLHLRFCVGNGAAQDDWELFVNYGVPDCEQQVAESDDLEPSRAPYIYDVDVDGYWVFDDRLKLTFLNTSTDMDGAGVWGILYWQDHPDAA